MPVRASSFKIRGMLTRSHRAGLYALPVLWLAYGLRLYRLDMQSIWWDEGHSIFVAQHPISQIPTLPAMDVHPPAYFALLHLWLGLTGQSEFAMRYLSVLFSILAVALLWKFTTNLARGLFPVVARGYAAPFAALLAAVSPLYVAYAQEVRGYAMITFLALASTFLLWKILFAPAYRQWTTIVGYVAVTAACLYTHYFTIFLLLFQNLAWLVWAVTGRDKEPGQRLPLHPGRAGLWVATQAGILLLFIPQLLLAVRQITGYTNPNLVPPAITGFISRSWQAYTVGLTINPVPARWGMAIIAALLLGGWVGLFIRGSQMPVQTRRFLRVNFIFLGMWLLLPLALYFVVLQRQPSFEPRYMMLVSPALFLLLAVSARHILPGRPGVAAAALLPAVLVVALYSYYTNPDYFKDDSAGVASWLARETTPNDIVYIDVPHPFHYYARRQGIPAPTRYLFVDIHTAAGILTAEAAGKDRLFWVTWRGSDTDPRGVIPFLAEKFGRLSGRQEFRGYTVSWYTLLPEQTGFTLPSVLPRVEATFGDVLRLDGAAFGGSPPREPATPAGEPAWATLHFTLLHKTPVNYRVSLRLQGEDGQVVSQIDKDLLNDRHFRTSAWPPNDPALNQAINVYTLPVPANTPPGNYRLVVIVYNAKPPYPSEGVSGPLSLNGLAANLGTLTILP